MKIYEFHAKNSYSSHPTLSLQEIESFENSSNIPEYAYLPDGSEISLDFSILRESAQFFTRAGYGVLKSGVRFKIIEKPTPDYHKKNGCGSCEFTLKLRSPFSLSFHAEMSIE